MLINGFAKDIIPKMIYQSDPATRFLTPCRLCFPTTSLVTLVSNQIACGSRLCAKLPDQRETAIRRVKGKVLEIGAGSGVNFIHYDPTKAHKLYAVPATSIIRQNFCEGSQAFRQMILLFHPQGYLGKTAFGGM